MLCLSAYELSGSALSPVGRGESHGGKTPSRVRFLEVTGGVMQNLLYTSVKFNRTAKSRIPSVCDWGGRGTQEATESQTNAYLVNI